MLFEDAAEVAAIQGGLARGLADIAPGAIEQLDHIFSLKGFDESFFGLGKRHIEEEILGDHLCIYGDVAATALSHGKPGVVEAYWKRLIDEVGKNGGFILGSGCAVPPDCKPENFRAMLETAKNYEFSKK